MGRVPEIYIAAQMTLSTLRVTRMTRTRDLDASAVSCVLCPLLSASNGRREAVQCSVTRERAATLWSRARRYAICKACKAHRAHRAR